MDFGCFASDITFLTFLTHIFHILLLGMRIMNICMSLRLLPKMRVFFGEI